MIVILPFLSQLLSVYKMQCDHDHYIQSRECSLHQVLDRRSNLLSAKMILN